MPLTDELALPPCPFCGATDEHIFVESVTGGYLAHCEDCLATAPEPVWRTRKPAAECPACHGLNTSCPEGCGRDPVTGELDGSTLPAAKPDQAAISGGNSGGMIWRDFMTPAETERLAEIERLKKAGQIEQRRIYDRCRKRMALAKGSIRTLGDCPDVA
jgi:hypothetical protein